MYRSHTLMPTRRQVSGSSTISTARCKRFVWQPWIWPETARWFDLPDAAALLLIPLSAVMMAASLSLLFLTKFSVSGVEIELVSSSPGQKPEGPVGQ